MTSSEREFVRSQKEKKKKKSLTIALVILSVILVALVVMLVLRATRVKQSRGNEAGMSIGDPDAPVKVIEFSNYTCSHCKNFTLNYAADFIKDYVDTGKVYYTVYPHPWSTEDITYNASLASYCAGDQNVFFAFKEKVFESVKTQDDLSDAKILDYARQIGADMEKFKTCLKGSDLPAQVEQAKALADSFNVTGTPSFIVNGKLVYMNDLVASVKQALGE